MNETRYYKAKNCTITIDDIVEFSQELWSEVNPEGWRYVTKRLACKIEDFILERGMAIIMN